MKLEIYDNGIIYTVFVSSYTAADRGDYYNPPQPEEIEYGIISMIAEDAENGFYIGDVAVGEPELDEMVLRAYHEEKYNIECDIADQKMEAARYARDEF